MNAWTRRALLLLIAAAMLLVGGAALIYRTLYQRYDSSLAQLNARSERLEGIVKAGTEISQNLQAALSAIAPWLHPPGESAANDVQQRLRDLVSAAGCTLVASQAALEPATDNQLARVRLTATVSGEWPQLLQLLQKIQQHRPPYWSESLSFMREGPATSDAPQSARLALQLTVPLGPEQGQP